MVALNKCGVNHRADRRGCECRADRFLLPEHNSHFHMHHAPLVPGLVYRCVLQAGWGHEIGLLGPTRLTGVWRDDRLSIHVQNRRLVGGVLLGDQEVQHTSTWAHVVISWFICKPCACNTSCRRRFGLASSYVWTNPKRLCQGVSSSAPLPKRSVLLPTMTSKLCFLSTQLRI